MESTALILIVISMLLLTLILGLLTFLIFKLLKQNQISKTIEASSPDDGKTYHPAIVDRMKDLERLKPKKSHLFCPNHPDEPGETVCAICDQLYCKACIKPFKSLHFCKEHLPLIMRHDWSEVFTMKTSTHDPEQGVRLYDMKKEIFENHDLPTYIETHYKINVDQDYIETYLVVFAIKEKVELVREKLSIHSND